MTLALSTSWSLRTVLAPTANALQKLVSKTTVERWVEEHIRIWRYLVCKLLLPCSLYWTTSQIKSKPEMFPSNTSMRRSGQFLGPNLPWGCLKVYMDLFCLELYHWPYASVLSDPYPYADYESSIRTSKTRSLLHQMERETIVLLENRGNVLPLSKAISSIAVVGPQADRVSVSHVGRYML